MLAKRLCTIIKHLLFNHDWSALLQQGTKQLLILTIQDESSSWWADEPILHLTLQNTLTLSMQYSDFSLEFWLHFLKLHNLPGISIRRVKLKWSKFWLIHWHSHVSPPPPGKGVLLWPLQARQTSSSLSCPVWLTVKFHVGCFHIKLGKGSKPDLQSVGLSESPLFSYDKYSYICISNFLIYHLFFIVCFYKGFNQSIWGGGGGVRPETCCRRQPWLTSLKVSEILVTEMMEAEKPVR